MQAHMVLLMIKNFLMDNDRKCKKNVTNQIFERNKTSNKTKENLLEIIMNLRKKHTYSSVPTNYLSIDVSLLIWNARVKYFLITHIIVINWILLSAPSYSS